MRARLLVGASVWVLVVAASAAAPSTQNDPRAASAQSGDSATHRDDDYPTLPPGEGRELMIRVCSECHSPESASAEALDEKGWKELVDDMAAKGANATDEEFDQIVKYLVKAFPPTK